MNSTHVKIPNLCDHVKWSGAGVLGRQVWRWTLSPLGRFIPGDKKPNLWEHWGKGHSKVTSAYGVHSLTIFSYSYFEHFCLSTLKWGLKMIAPIKVSEVTTWFCPYIWMLPMSFILACALVLRAWVPSDTAWRAVFSISCWAGLVKTPSALICLPKRPASPLHCWRLLFPGSLGLVGRVFPFKHFEYIIYHSCLQGVSAEPCV